MESKTSNIVIAPLDVKLNFIDVTLDTMPVKLNSLFGDLTLTSFEELGGLV